jgi:hypothetical protein
MWVIKRCGNSGGSMESAVVVGVEGDKKKMRREWRGNRREID